jgi:hypothetical protein
MVVEATGAGGQPGGLLDRGDARPFEPVLAEELHGGIEDAFPGCG